MSPIVLALVLLALAAALAWDAPRQARRLAGRLEPDADATALHHELTVRLRASAIGGAAGTLAGLVSLALGAGAGTTDGPEGLRDVAILATGFGVAAVAAETVTVLRRGTRPAPAGPRTASLAPRDPHGGRLALAAALALGLLALVAGALAVAAFRADVPGAAGAIAAAVGALTVVLVSAAMRRRLAERAVRARDTDDLAVQAAADAATADRTVETLVAGGTVLTLCSLLVPVLGSPGTLRTLGLALALVVLGVGAALTATDQLRGRVDA